MEEQPPRVVIGMDPHKRSVTIEVMTADESVVGGPATRRLVLRAPAAGQYELKVPLRRSFAKSASAACFCISVSTMGTRKSPDLTAGDSSPRTVH